MDLIDTLYEAALIGDKWPDVLENFGHTFNSKGALLFSMDKSNLKWVGGGEAKRIMQKNIDLGWMAKNDRPERAARLNYDHFITDTDLYSPEEILRNPYYSEFLVPHGVGTFCATFAYGLEGDACVFSLEGMLSDAAARAAIPKLDALRPHIARSVMLSSRLKLERARAMTDAMKAIGVPAAVINPKGQIRAVNDLFEPLIGRKVLDRRTGITLANVQADKLLQTTLTAMALSPGNARSIPLPATEVDKARILHLLPVAGEARDLFSSASVLVIIAGGHNAADIEPPLLQALFDLTPAEAKVTRALASGLTVSEIAQTGGVSTHTVRTQLKFIMAKTATHSQAQLISLLKDLSLGSKTSTHP